MTKKDTIAEALDAFLDKFMYELPVPRFASECHEEPCDVRLCVLVAANRCGIDVSEHIAPTKTEALETSSNCFMSLFPMLSILRSSKASIEHQALTACLMALDPSKARLVPEDMYFDAKFCTMAYDIIAEDTGRVVASALEALNATAEHLHSNDIKHARDGLPVAQSGWTLCSELEAMKLLSSEQSKAIDDFCDLYAYQSSLSKATLYSMCCIRDVLEEVPTMGYRTKSIDDGV
jgi:hypothetical protein